MQAALLQEMESRGSRQVRAAPAGEGTRAVVAELEARGRAEKVKTVARMVMLASFGWIGALYEAFAPADKATRSAGFFDEISHVIGVVISVAIALIGLAVVLQVASSIAPTTLTSLANLDNTLATGKTNNTVGDSVLHVMPILVAVVVVLGLILLVLAGAFAFAHLGGSFGRGRGSGSGAF
jgi:hypothetical protein